MKKKYLWQIYNFFKVILRLPFLFIYYLVKRKQIFILQFTSDSYLAIEKTFLKINWDVENACLIWISGIGFIPSKRGFKLVSPKRKRNNYKIISLGVGGIVIKSIPIKVISVNPRRYKVEITDFKSRLRENLNNYFNSISIKKWNYAIKQEKIIIAQHRISPRFAEFNLSQINRQLDLVRQTKNEIELLNIKTP